MAANAPPVANRAVRRVGLRRGRLASSSRARSSSPVAAASSARTPTSAPPSSADIGPDAACSVRANRTAASSVRPAVASTIVAIVPSRTASVWLRAVSAASSSHAASAGDGLPANHCARARTCRSLESSANRAQRSAASSISCSLPSVRWAIASRKATTATPVAAEQAAGDRVELGTIARSSPESSASSARPTAAGPAAST